MTTPKPTDAKIIEDLRAENRELRAALMRWGEWAHSPEEITGPLGERALEGTPYWAFPYEPPVDRRPATALDRLKAMASSGHRAFGPDEPPTPDPGPGPPVLVAM